MALGPRAVKLLAIGSSPFGPAINAAPALSKLRAIAPAARVDALTDLAALIAARNGFHAAESALNVYGIGSPNGDLHERNATDGWRAAYQGRADGLVFFAEDLFGVQFAIGASGIVTFDPESGDCEQVAPTLEAWCGAVLDDLDVQTGYPLGHEWQMRHGALPVGQRLAPIRPFVLGGEFVPENLRAMEAIASLYERARLAMRIATLPDGAQIHWP